jgi:antitoxin ParD1/3/4
MTSLNLSLPDDMSAFIEAQKRQAKRELEAELREGLQGPSVEMTREDWESIEREALDGLDGESIRP